MDLVLALAREKNAELACATDPDADRLAVAVRDATGGYQMLSGDTIGILLADYLLHKPHSYTPIVCTTVVSSGMLQTIAAALGADYYETLTGFKWLANTALEHEDGQHRFLYAYEEALGYAVGRQVLDKDGLSALLAFAQMTAQLNRQGKTVLDQLEQLYRRHGLFLTRQHSRALQAQAPPIGELLRRQPPRSIAGNPVLQTDDLEQGLRHHADGASEQLSLPRSDVLIYRLENGARIVVRPSGTEPKLKCYYEVRETVAENEAFAAAHTRAEHSVQALLSAHQQSLAELIQAG